MLADGRLVRRNIHAIDFVVGHVAFEPLDLRPELLENAARSLSHTVQLFRREFSDSPDFTFDYVFWHMSLLFAEPCLKRPQFNLMLHVSPVNHFGIVIVSPFPTIRIEITQHEKIINRLKHIDDREQ